MRLRAPRAARGGAHPSVDVRLRGPGKPDPAPGGARGPAVRREAFRAQPPPPPCHGGLLPRRPVEEAPGERGRRSRLQEHSLKARGAVAGDRREVFGWMMYQWSFHGFVTTVQTVLFAPYVTELAQQAVGENGRVFALGGLGAVTAKSFWPLCVSLSVLLQAFLLPVLGAAADYSSRKKRLLMLTGYTGAAATSLLYFVGAGLDFRWGGLLFVIANLSLGATTVVYNAFLPEITAPGERDRVSSRGYALGYLGGGLLLGANLLFMRFANALGFATSHAMRLCLLSAGLWWFGFSLVSFLRLKSRLPGQP